MSGLCRVCRSASPSLCENLPVSMLLALVFFALLAGLFFGLGVPPGDRSLLGRAAPRQLQAGRVLPGAGPDSAIEVRSPAVIEERAQRWPCPVCSDRVYCEHHRVEQVADRRYRVATATCRRCGHARDVWFFLIPVQS